MQTVDPAYFRRQEAQAISEAELSEWVIDLATMLGWTVFHARDSRGQRLVGLPDLELVRDRQRLRVELKREKGKLTANQEETIAKLRRSGETVHVWRPSDWVSGEIERVLRGAG